LTKTEATRQFRELVAQYGIRWTAKVPHEAYEQLARCNEVLTEADRRAALTGGPKNPRDVSMSAQTSDRLLVLACSATKRSEEGRIPARERYDGPLWRTLRAVDPEGRAARVAFLSARFGFRAASTPIENYNARLTPQLARLMIAGGMTTRWPRPSRPNRPDTYGAHPGCEIASLTDYGRVRVSEVALVGGHLYLEVMRSFVEGFRSIGYIPSNVVVIEINGPIGRMRQSLRCWLEQGAKSATPVPEAV
jgi:hypothetical protein